MTGEYADCPPESGGVRTSLQLLTTGSFELCRALPLLDRRGGCAIKKSRVSDQNRADGVVVPINPLNNHPGASRHPSCPGGAILRMIQRIPSWTGGDFLSVPRFSTQLCA
jgi:hypothetical protein